MEDLERVFEHLIDHRILRCRQCRYAVVPSHIKAHLTRHHKALSRAVRRAISLAAAALPHLAHEPAAVVFPQPQDNPVDGFPVWSSRLRCLGDGPEGECPFIGKTTSQMQEHCKDQHAWSNVQTQGGDKRTQEKHTPNKMWRTGVSCQQFFREPEWKKCFEVAAGPEATVGRLEESGRDGFFSSQRAVQERCRTGVADSMNQVEAFDAHRSTVVPWLRETGIAEHLRGLKKDEIRAAIALPSAEGEPVLHIIVDELECVLRKAHRACFDGEDCMLTWPCRVTLGRFQSAQIEAVGKTRPFDPYKEEETLQTYFRTGKQLLCYLHRVAASTAAHFSRIDDSPQPEDVIELTEDQRRQWDDIYQLAGERLAKTSGGDTDSDSDAPTDCADDGLGDELLRLLMLLVCHQTGARRYRSPLLSFCSMLALKVSTGSWMEAGNFNSHLSALIWVVQLVVFYSSAQLEQQGLGKTHSLVKGYCEEYLQQAVEAPMGEILRWRLLLFHVSKNSVSDHEATWDETEQVLSYEGTEFHLDYIPTLLQTEYVECHKLLYEDLMLGDTSVRRMRAAELKDNAGVAIVGWNFTQHPENNAVLAGTDTALLNTIEHSDRLGQLLLQPPSGSSTAYKWRLSAIALYEGAVQRFLERFCSLFHISSGQPVRETELFSITWRNTQRKRAVSLQHQRVMVHTQYDKMQAKTGRYKDNVRFPPHTLGDMLLDYIVYVQPLRQLFLQQTELGAKLSPFLWEKDGAVWPRDKLSRCLEGASTRARIPRLHTANWRQMTVAIVKTKFAGDIRVFQDDEGDEDAEEMNGDIRAMTRQRNHKTQTVNRAYANQTGASFGGVWDGLIRMGLRASTLWQDFWGVDIVLRGSKRRGLQDESTLAKRVAMGVYRPKKAWSSDALLAGMRKLFGRPDMEWKSAEQCRAITSMMGWSEQVVAILPTGAGKSMLFMLPCSLPDAASTILVVPLVALRGDLLRRVGELGLECVEWLPGERREAPLIMVSVEAAASSDFTKYAQQLIARQRLDRVVIDECHLTVTAAEYRASVVDLTAIRALRTQFVYLTATLPPAMWDEFESRNHLVSPQVIRAASNRPNLFYMVRKAVRGRGSLSEQAAAEVRDAWEESGLFDQRRDKIILYAQTIDEATALADVLGCTAYTSKSGTAEEKQQILATWIESSDRPYIVATTALAEGFDYPHVRLVLNVDEPESLVLFAQESGRAGRDGQKAYSMVLLPAAWEAPSCSNEEGQLSASLTHDVSLRKRRDRQAMRQYLQAEQCFRTSLSEHLDTSQFRRWCMEGDVPCDVCRVYHIEPIPPRPTQGAHRSHTGFDAIQQQKLRDHLELAGYQERLAAIKGTCLFCRTLGEQWDHTFTACSQRMEVIGARNRTRRRHEEQGRRWLQPYTACFLCLNPQAICQRAAAEDWGKSGQCEYRDAVLPACYGVYRSVQGPRWIQEKFGRVFEGVDAFLDWIGEETTFGGGRAVQGVRVVAAALVAFDPSG